MNGFTFGPEFYLIMSGAAFGIFALVLFVASIGTK